MMPDSSDADVAVGGKHLSEKEDKLLASERLRESTRARHEALHGVVDLGVMTGNHAKYIQGLDRYLTAVTFVESELLRLLQLSDIPAVEDLVWDDRLTKRVWIEEDITYLRSQLEKNFGGKVDAKKPTQEQSDLLLPLLNEPNTHLPVFAGMAYVTEGMTLGGVYICKTIREKLHLRDRGTRFFRGYGDSTKANWLSTKRFLNEVGARDDVDFQLMDKAACKTFDFFATVLGSA